MRTAEIGIHNAEILDNGCATYFADKSDIPAAAADIQTADGVSLPIECAGIGHVVIISYRCPLNEVARVGITVGGQHIFIDHDVGGQFGVDICVAAVDKCRKAVKFPSRADAVKAVTVQWGRCRRNVCPRRRGEQCND